MSEQYALLWSRKADLFHIEPVAKTCETGLFAFRRDAFADIVLLTLGTQSEVRAKADELRAVIIDRDESRKLKGME